VIVNAHQDSTNLLPFLAAPGADDDGSGTTSLLGAFSSLVNASFVPSKHPLELQWSSAEEGGLLGSKAIAQDYAKRGVKVAGMLQIDMTAWVKAGTKPTVGLIRDFVDPEFVEYLAKVIDEYSNIGYTDTKCGYACASPFFAICCLPSPFIPLHPPLPSLSPLFAVFLLPFPPPLPLFSTDPSFVGSDHASWSAIGAPAAFTIESTFENSSKNIHSSRDTIDYSPSEFSFEHVKEFSKVALGLIVELAGGENLIK
jgi:leucyl aminopeptidase